jgi:hypothetical protein
MVPLRSEYDESKTSSWQNGPRPRLVLCDTTRDAVPVTAKSVARPRKPLPRWDSLILGLAVVSVLLFFVVSFFGFLWHSINLAYQPSFGSSTPVITRRVASGDTLWRYASKYGDPNSYILDRVEKIARDNHLSSNSPLVPGQYIKIGVENPSIIDQIQRQNHSRLASLPRSL